MDVWAHYVEREPDIDVGGIYQGLRSLEVRLQNADDFDGLSI